MSIKRLCLSVMVLSVALVLGCGGNETTEDTRGRRGPLIDKPAPEIVGQNSAGESMRLSDFQGKVVMLDFWATWCAPCRMMFPHNKGLVVVHKDRPFVLLGVNVDDKVGALKDAEANQGLTWKSWWDGPGQPISRQYQVRAYPTIYLIDARGTVRYRFEGVPPEGALDAAIEKLLKEDQ